MNTCRSTLFDALSPVCNAISLFGLCTGAVRHKEVLRLNILLCQWHNNFHYYWTESLKKGSMSSCDCLPKMVEHQLTFSRSRIALLTRYAIKLNSMTDSKQLMIQSPSSKMLFLVRDIFGLNSTPTMLNVWHLFISIRNALVLNNDKDSKMASSVVDHFITKNWSYSDNRKTLPCNMD